MKFKTIKLFKLLFVLLVTSSIMQIYAEAKENNPSVDGVDDYTMVDYHMRYIDDSYTVNVIVDQSLKQPFSTWHIRKSDDGKRVTLIYNNGKIKFADCKMKIPDCFTGKTYGTFYVTDILGSCNFKEFDLNPENEYMKLVDNVVFSKDGKTLMSYAQNDEREIYEIPDGVIIIGEDAFGECNNIKQLSIPDSVTEMDLSAMYSLEKVNIPDGVEELYYTFKACQNLNDVYISPNSELKKIGNSAFAFTKVNELTLPSFEIEISKAAFVKTNINLKSYIKPNVSYEKVDENTCRLEWDKIANASCYEVYQKKNDGTYKLLKTVKGNSIKINKLKIGKNYTFAVKPYAEIKAYSDKYPYPYYHLPEYYTIEGTMSEDVTVDLK